MVHNNKIETNRLHNVTIQYFNVVHFMLLICTLVSFLYVNQVLNLSSSDVNLLLIGGGG